MSIKCVIIDDECPAIELLELYVSKVPFLNNIKSFNDSHMALDFLNSNQVDLVFLDIEMPFLNGFNLIDKLINKPYFIVTSAFDKYAVEAYNMAINDYILKPICFERFLISANRAKKYIERDRIWSKDKRASVNFRTGWKIEKVNIDEILYVQGMRDYLSIFTKTKRIITLMTFRELLKKLPYGKFLRIHKSYLVAIDKIDQINTNKVKINNVDIPIGGTYKNEFFCTMEKLYE